MKMTRYRSWLHFAATAALISAACGVQAAPESLKFCSGGEGGFYESLATTIGGAIVKGTSTKLQVLNTGGSIENAEKLTDRECDIAVIQADAVITQKMPPDVKVVDAHTEVVYWLFPKGGPVNDFGKMENDKVAAKYSFATVSGSGALVTLKNWIKTDKDYEGAVPIEFDSWYSAAEAVSQGYVVKAGVRVEIAGMLYIGRPGKITSDITEDFGQQLTIGEVNDSSFKDAKDANNNPLYTQCTIAKDARSGLAIDTTLEPDTYCLKAQIVFNNAYLADLDPAEAKKVRRAVDKGINSTVKAVR